MAEKEKSKSVGGSLSLLVTKGEMGILLKEAENMGNLHKLLAESPLKGKSRLVTLSDVEWESVAGMLSRTAFGMKASRRRSEIDSLIEAIEDLLLLEEGDEE